MAHNTRGDKKLWAEYSDVLKEMGLSWELTNYFVEVRSGDMSMGEKMRREQKKKKWETLIQRRVNQIAFGILRRAKQDQPDDGAYFIHKFNDKEEDQKAEKIIEELKEDYEMGRGLRDVLEECQAGNSFFDLGEESVDKARGKRIMSEIRTLVEKSK